MKKKSKINHLLYTIVCVLRISWKYDRIYLICYFPQIFIEAGMTLISVIFPKLIIDAIMAKETIYVIAVIVIGIFFLRFILQSLRIFLSNLCKQRIIRIRTKMFLDIMEKSMSIPYSYLEQPRYMDMKENAFQCIENNYDISRVLEQAASFLSNCLSLIGMAYIISRLHILIILLVLLVVLLNSAAKAKEAGKSHFFRTSFSKMARKLSYITGVTWDSAYVKDIKLYRLGEWLNNKKQDYLKYSSRNSIKIFVLSTIISVFSILTSSLEQLIVYGCLVFQVIRGALSLGDFTMILNAVDRFSDCLASLMTAYVSISEAAMYLSDFLAYRDLESAYMGKMCDDKRKVTGEDFEIEFRDVSFSYPESNEQVLKHISIKLSKGEKLSIVGENGAGKSTFVKLLMRLYEPTEGRIFLNGIDIREYDMDEYMRKIAVVFQDYKILAFSIKENISFENYEEKRFKQVIKLMGLEEAVKDLPKGADTCLSKEFDKEGIEFSGGEKQKVAIARALYKDASFLILDEPIANLSPIAEFEFYKNFNEIVSGKMAIYISHRLSSCQFCDKIAVFADGRIVEYGTHKELLKQQGLYAEMFQAQAQFYKIPAEN